MFPVLVLVAATFVVPGLLALRGIVSDSVGNNFQPSNFFSNIRILKTEPKLIHTRPIKASQQFAIPDYLYNFFSVVSLIVLLPTSYKSLGPLSIAVTAVTFAISFAFSRHSWQRRAESSIAAAGLVGLAVHSFIDGASFFSFGTMDYSQVILPLILLDRISVGFLAWVLATSLFGRLGGFLALLLIGFVTFAGYQFIAFASQLLAHTESLAWINAILLGFLLHHLVVHGFGRKCH